MSEVVTYRHSCNSGDLISLMAGMQHVYRTTGKKAWIYQRLNMAGDYYNGAVHPVKDENGVQVCMNEKQWKMLKPLLEWQEYVERAEVWEGQQFDINLDKMREGQYTTMPFGSINRWAFYTHPALACDLSKSWINVPSGNVLNDEYAIVNFTERYRNNMITYYFLKKWEDKLVFAGTKEEHELFCKDNKLDIKYLEVDNFLTLAMAIKGAKFTLCNQSFIYNICEAMKTPRVLEVCRFASNCIPVGENAYDFLHQDALEFYVERFMGQTPKLARA